MNQKNDVENIDFNKEKNVDPDIEYNSDFTSEKTKSLNKFPLKILTNNDFYLDDIYKNFSKSLKFNSHKCYAPKPIIIQSSKNPTPIIFEKQSDSNNLNTQDKIIVEDALTEKELSFDSSFSSDIENEIKKPLNCDINKNNINIDLNYNNQIINFNDSNYIISKNLLDISDKKGEDKNEGLYENKINIIEENNNLKSYEHKTITSFPINSYNFYYTKGNIKAIRNSLYRAKMKCLREKYREVEYSIKDRMKIKYGLDIRNNKPKKLAHNNIDFCKIIPINNDIKEENIVSNKKVEEIEDMTNLRKTISYNTSKLNLENNKKSEEKGITIYDILITNKKNKNRK